MPRTRKRYSREEKETILKNFEQSGLGIVQFCRQNGPNPITLSNWLRQRRESKFTKVSVMPSQSVQSDRFDVSVRKGDIELRASSRSSSAAWVSELLGTLP